MMKKKVLVIGLVLVVLATVFACGCLEDYYTSLDTADAKLAEAAGYIYAWSELIDQERFDAADAKLDGAVTAISMAEANVDDAKDMGAPKEETNEYDAAILYLKRWIFIGRSTTNLCKLIEEMDEKGYSGDLNQKLIAETDKMLINLDTAEILGLNLIEKYPTIASELEVAKDIKDIKLLRKEYQDLKNMFLTVDEPVEVTKTTAPAPTPMPTRYRVITPTQTPTPIPKAVFPITYPICITVDAGTSWIIYTLGDYNYLIMGFGDAMTGEETHDEGGRWELTSTTKTTRTYNLYWSDGKYLDTVKIYSNGQAIIISPGIDNIAATWD